MTAGLTNAPTVSAGLARGLMRLAVSQGAGESELAACSGIDPVSLRDQDERVPLASYVALMRAGQSLSGDPALALHFAERIDLAELSIVGMIGPTCETMFDVLVQLNRYYRLVAEWEIAPKKNRFEHQPAGDGHLWLVDNRKNPNDFPEATEGTFARLVCGPRMFDQTTFCRAVHVTHAAPADPWHRSEYERIFQAPVVFESDKNALLIDETWPARKVATRHPYAFGILSERAAALLASLESVATVRGRVERLLIPILHAGEPRMAAIAKQLGTTRPTLYRQLRSEGVSFESVLDDLRFRQALHYLDGKKVSINETAYLVGFSDPSAFSRAFKRWTGHSPAQRTGRIKTD